MTATSPNPPTSLPAEAGLAAHRARQSRQDKLNNRALAWIGALLLVITIGVGVARFTGYGAWQAPDAPIASERLIQFSDRADAGVIITDVTTGEVIATFALGEGGFIRGVARTLTRDRRIEQASRDAPFRLARRIDGVLLLQDTATGRVVHLNSFGSTNLQAFASLLDNKGKAP
jgi:putative photosynthetic complex assembly protein